MSTRYFRAKKDSFLWVAGAIIKKEDDEKGYAPIDDSRVWDVTEVNNGEYITANIIENCPEWFEEVYKINMITRCIYKLKAEAREILNAEYTYLL
jgi:hypothetical protein